ncbi:hypothetical protein GTA08_BOTSDO01843 [Botryosphaeria dothidea]|uniref:Uncharacterized protein n=1 Tax=Botryosphaeria dothidea TaxID=55169 RepID=A0A8H4J1C6_9PEZI|nr:hypothetical protein GTA08_BOTSDO01843 [Botryosphaeria dothidea]
MPKTPATNVRLLKKAELAFDTFPDLPFLAPIVPPSLTETSGGAPGKAAMVQHQPNIDLSSTAAALSLPQPVQLVKHFRTVAPSHTDAPRQDQAHLPERAPARPVHQPPRPPARLRDGGSMQAPAAVTIHSSLARFFPFAPVAAIICPI